MKKELHSTRLTWVDLLKAIAIYFVVFYHNTLYTTDILDLHASHLVYLQYYLKTILSVCVPLFFFVNGYLLFQRPFDFKKHIRKTIKLILLALIWNIITLLLLMVLKNQRLSIQEIIKSLWILKKGWTNHLWYIGALVCIYVLFPILKITYDSNRKVFYFFTIIVAIFTFGNVFLNQMGSILVTNLLHKPYLLTQNFFGMFDPFRGIYGYTFVYFCLGGIVSDHFEKIIGIPKVKRNQLALLGLLFGTFGLFGMGIFYSRNSGSVWDVVWNGYDTIFTLISTLSIFLFSLNDQSNISFISSISKNTLGIYFIHLLIIYPMYPHVRDIPILCNFVGNLVYSFLILVVSWTISCMMKKIPLIKKLVT